MVRAVCADALEADRPDWQKELTRVRGEVVHETIEWRLKGAEGITTKMRRKWDTWDKGDEHALRLLQFGELQPARK